MTFPDYLHTGDSIGIIATARKISEREMNPAINYLNNKGFKVILGKNLHKSEHQFAGNDTERAEDLQEMLDNPEIKAILIARGGYGTSRILTQINLDKFKANPKWIVGYSDITALHSYIHSKTGIATIHATMPINFPKEGKISESVNSLLRALSGKSISYELPEHLYNTEGETEGIIVGGNLSVLYSLNGTLADIDTKGKILFIEDLDEYLYHIDRMILNFKLNGKLEHLKGLIVGGMTDMHDNNVPFGKTAYKIINDLVKEYKYPKIFNFPAGHIGKNMALYFGKEVQLKVSKEKVIINFK